MREPPTDDAGSGYRQSPFDFAAFAVEDAKAVFRELQDTAPYRQGDGVVVVTKMADILATTKRRDIGAAGHDHG